MKNKFDAFTAGIDPGGLRSQIDIKLLICYILLKIEPGVLKEDIVKVLQEQAIANYFEINDAFSVLLANKNIEKKEENYILTKVGKMASLQLIENLPISIKEKAINAIINLLKIKKIEKENVVKIEEMPQGFMVNCNISGGDFDLLNFSLYVPERMQAQTVKKNFHANPELFYDCILALAVQNSDLVEIALEKISQK